MNEGAAADGRKNTIPHSLVRSKFKKLVCECKSISLSQRTTHGISCYHVEKGYRKWRDILFLLIATKESAGPSNIAESLWFDNDNQNTYPENGLGGSKNATADKRGECKPTKNIETIKQFTNLTKSFINNDPTEKLLKTGKRTSQE